MRVAAVVMAAAMLRGLLCCGMSGVMSAVMALLEDIGKMRDGTLFRLLMRRDGVRRRAGERSLRLRAWRQ